MELGKETEKVSCGQLSVLPATRGTRQAMCQGSPNKSIFKSAEGLTKYEAEYQTLFFLPVFLGVLQGNTTYPHGKDYMESWAPVA